MMIGIADQFSLTQLLIGGILFLVLQFVLFRYMMGRLNANPAESPDSVNDRESEILGDQPVRSAVAPPRLRRLQPTPRTGVTEPLAAGTSDEADRTPATVPVDKLPVEKTEAPVEKKSDPYAPFPVVGSETTVPGPEETLAMPAFASFSLSKPEEASAKLPIVSMPAAEEKTPEPLAAAASAPAGPASVSPAEPPAAKSPDEKISLPSISLPPLATEKPVPAVEPASFVPVPAMPAASLVQTPDTKPAGTPVTGGGAPVEPRKEEPAPKSAPPEVVPVAAIPRRFFVNPFAKAAKTEPKAEATPPAPVSSQPEPVPVPLVPTVEPAGEGVVAVSGPASLEGAQEPSATADAEESDDVKKRKTPKTPKIAPERAGLVLIPPITAAGGEDVPAAKPAGVEAKAEPPAGALILTPAPEAKAEPAPVPPATKLVGRPRIFLPANAPKEEVAAEKPAPEPVVPTEVVEAKDVPAPEAAEAIAAKPEGELVPEVKPAEPVSEVKPEEMPVVVEDKVEPEPEKKVEEPKAEDKPVAVEEKPSEKPVESVLPVPVDPIAAVPLAAEPPSVPPPLPEAAKPAEKTPEPEVPRPAAEEPPPIPLLPKTVPTPAAAPEGSLSLAAAAPAHSITTPEPAMPSTDPNTSSSATGRASAQLTLGFEITSLQLTPFFKLGCGAAPSALQHRLAAPHWCAAAENPLAAGISFQIDRVELDGRRTSSRSTSSRARRRAGCGYRRSPSCRLIRWRLSAGFGGSADLRSRLRTRPATAVQLLATLHDCGDGFHAVLRDRFAAAGAHVELR